MARSQSGPDPRNMRATAMLATRSRAGVALVITLIMLSVITFLAVTFLVLSQRERGSVTTHTDQETARFAADGATERAKVELLAPMLAFQNAQKYGLIVSTNFVNPYGFDPAALDYRTNINYDYTFAGGHPALTGNQELQNLANLLYNPRPPVFVTNRFTGRLDFRYYLDLNRNGFYDTNGFQPDIGVNGLPIVNNGVTNYEFAYGDPEWIGVLEHPDQPHSGNNRFVARYAYIVVPAGLTLDVNAIHNDTLDHSFTAQDGFLRNQGVGSWEINLAAFLYDLNTNTYGWGGLGGVGGYSYRQPYGNFNLGAAFDDARSFVYYRYAGLYGTTMLPANSLLGNAASLPTDGIDEYSDGPLMFGTTPIDESLNPDKPGRAWLGSDNPIHYFGPGDFFDSTKLSQTFVNRMSTVSTNVDTYDRDTYYRMLSQLGTDSSPEQGKINVNYQNVNALGNVVSGMETNRVNWANAGQFFTNAANMLMLDATSNWLSGPVTAAILNGVFVNGVFVNSPLSAYAATFGVTNAFGITNIPVYSSYTYRSNSVLLTNVICGYTPAVHRLLQVVANIYDATTNRIVNPPRAPYPPSVFRPVFRRDNFGNIFIACYLEVNDASMVTTAPPLMLDMDLPADRTRVPLYGQKIGTVNAEPMIYGIPMVIGAKKGYPSFNKFALENQVTATRKLEFHRPAGQPVNQTNQVYMLSLTNSFGIQAWNSYNVAFPHALQMIAVGDVSLVLSNQFGVLHDANLNLLSRTFSFGTNTIVPASTWAGFSSPQSPVSFKVPLLTNDIFLTNSLYIQGGNVGNTTFYPESPTTWDAANTFRIPQWWVSLRSRVRFILVDTSVSPNRIVDYVNLDSTQAPLNVNSTMNNGASCTGSLPSGDPDAGSLWCTNRIGNPTSNPAVDNPLVPTYGIINQVNISLGLPSPVADSIWQNFNANNLTVNDKLNSIRTFQLRYFSNGTNNDDLTFDAPFQPTRTFYQYVRWEANDPLVHYTVPDLTDLLAHPGLMQQNDDFQLDSNDKSPIKRLISSNPLSDHYRPWGGNPNNPGETSPMTQFNTGVRDPLVTKSDDWDFMTNKLPNIGWFGRVHRGSPWQTVYLKAADTNSWQMWSGDTNIADAYYSRPVNDRLLFDVFTAAISPNATLGQLPVNQPGLAAWSAVLSGVIIPTNNTGGWTVIQPAGIYTTNQMTPLALIVQGINATRANTNASFGPVFGNNVFNHVGDVLATPQLTDQNPYLNMVNLHSRTAGGLTDEMLERIPQQIMGLLTLNHSPRFVIYSYGQTLRPAPNSIITAGGPYFQMCTNYQITAETATRSVVRVDGSFVPGTSNYPPHIVVEQYNVLPP